MSYEYKVVPAPTRGLKAKGVKTPEDRFANALETTMNELAEDGWEYLRTDTLPCEQREGLMSKTTVFQNMLVFRRTTKQIAETAPVADLVAPVAPPVEAPRPAARRVEPEVGKPLPPLKTGAERIAEKIQPKPITPAPRPSPDVAAE